MWISPDLKNINDKQKIFIENIKRDTKALIEDEILQVPFDELKEIIQNKVVIPVQLAKPTYSKEIIHNKGKGTIYLIYDKIDYQLSNEIAAYLEVEGYDVIFSDFKENQAAARKTHQENLCSCDASIIICGSVNTEWINIKLQDIIKAPGFGRSKLLKAKALYIDNEKFKDVKHKLLNLDNCVILENSYLFRPDNLFLFLNKITA
ncbi:MAG: hypothetical protein M3421_00745 [Bacteroidota bacterium]|nr:hypothetical protein [Bacteroidota bacterium]